MSSISKNDEKNDEMSSNHKELYKRSIDLGEQQKQRQLAALEEQKHQRQQQQDQFRHVDSNEEESNDEAEQQTQSKPQRKQHRKRGGNNSKNKAHKGLQYRLQQSEWLRQRPENLCDWLLVPCPVGKRCLVIATHGRTYVYNQGGRKIMDLRSLLPGDGHQAKYRSILDCVYVAESETFYVLDAIAFGQQQLLNCEASFRFFWLRSRFDEQGELGQCSKRNEKPFKLLNYYDFEDANAVDEVLQKHPLWEEDHPQLDGLLFYHKEGSYTCGTTPLVCWLFAFMLPDVLGLPVHSGHVPPDDYRGNPLVYMDEFDKKLLARRQQYKNQAKAARKPKQEAAPVSMEQEEDDGELAEFDELRSILEHERRLELGELDMDCTSEQEPESQAASAGDNSCC